MLEYSALLKPVIVVTCAIYSFQALVFSVLCLLGILVFTNCIDIKPSKTSPVALALHNYFSEKTAEDGSPISSDLLFYFNCAYIVLSVFTLAINVRAFAGLNGKRSTLKRRAYICVGIAFLTSIFDVIVGCLLAVEYDARLKEENEIFRVSKKGLYLGPNENNKKLFEIGTEKEKLEMVSAAMTAAFILMTISMRGFALWIFNIALGIEVIIVGKNDDGSVTAKVSTRQEVINAYQLDLNQKENMERPWRASKRWSEISQQGVVNHSQPMVHKAIKNKKPNNKTTRYAQDTISQRWSVLK